jgi:hypothetical protein
MQSGREFADVFHYRFQFTDLFFLRSSTEKILFSKPVLKFGMNGGQLFKLRRRNRASRSRSGVPPQRNLSYALRLVRRW